LLRAERGGRLPARRRARVEALARELDGVAGEGARVEEAQVARGEAMGRLIGEASEDLLDLVDR
jgi:hypothetical protein